MIELDASAQSRLDQYLDQVRVHLRGCRSVDPWEVERDVREHIERELGETAKPASAAELDRVLERLGSPAQWIPEEETAWWRRTFARLRSGPEDWRLAYLSLGLFILAFFSGRGMFPLLIAASFFISRAAVSLASEPREMQGKKWLLYPSLVVVYVIVGFLLLFLPTIGLCSLADECENSRTIQVFPWSAHDDAAYWPLAVMFIVAGTGLWWLVLGLVAGRWSRPFQAVFHPFFERLKPPAIKGLVRVGGILFVVSAVIGAAMLKYPERWYPMAKQWW